MWMSRDSTNALGGAPLRIPVVLLVYDNYIDLFMASHQAENSRSGNKLERLLVEALLVELTDSTPKERDDTLSMLKLIFDNIIQHPNDDKYRQIKLTDESFLRHVWRYSAGVKLIKMSGWEEDGDYVKLKDDNHAEAMVKLLEQELQRKRISTPQVTDPLDINSSSECCVFTNGKISAITCAVLEGDGGLFRELLRPYHFACFKNGIRRFAGFSILELACCSRQIGIARILANEYGVDFSSSSKEEVSLVSACFKACDSTELCQSSIVQFIKEFKIDVHSYRQLSALHLAVLHKLPTVVKFLVEHCKVNVNCVSNMGDDGTPLHMAYGIGDESIARYLIEHGADQDALDEDSRKPVDSQFFSINRYSSASNMVIKQREIYKRMGSDEYNHYNTLINQGYDELKAIEPTFKKFQSLRQENLVGGIANDQNRPTMQKLSRYIEDMTPSYQTIGLELGVPFATLKIIRNDPNMPDLRDKCLEMLHVWLKNDISATWKKLCDALQEAEMRVLADQIKSSLQI